MDALLGFDVGTYSSKGVLCLADGTILAEARITHDVSMPRQGHVEQDADGVWWHDLVYVTRRLMAALPSGTRVAAVGISAIGPCLLPVDGAGLPLRPAILYGADNRATTQLQALERDREADIVSLSGTPLTSQAVGPKILWLLENEPEVMRRTSKLLTATGYLVFRLTGQMTADHHTASYFAPFYDLRNARWDLRFADGAVSPDLLPDLRWPAEIAGCVTVDAAAATGIPVGTPVLVGTTDGAAEAVGVGVVHPGDLMISYGSTAALVMVLDSARTVPPLWTTRGSWADEFVITAALATSGSITVWFREQLARDLGDGKPGNGSEVFAELAREAMNSPVGARGLLLLPYFSGERSPFNDPGARGVIAGLTLAHTRGDLYRAILEGTAFGLRHNLQVLASAGTIPSRAVAVGGGTASRLWMEIVSDVTGLTQEVPEQTVGACYGDAYLAATAMGLQDRHAAGTHPWTRIVDRIEPDPDRRDRYATRYSLYRALYEQTRDIVHELARERDGAPAGS